MSGEIPGVREAQERLTERMREGGLPSDYARRKSEEAARRLDTNIREGRVQKPR